MRCHPWLWISLCSVHNLTKRNPSVSGHVTSTPNPTFMHARRHVVQHSLQDKSDLVRFPALAALTIHTAYLTIFISSPIPILKSFTHKYFVRIFLFPFLVMFPSLPQFLKATPDLFWQLSRHLSNIRNCLFKPSSHILLSTFFLNTNSLCYFK